MKKNKVPRFKEWDPAARKYYGRDAPPFMEVCGRRRDTGIGFVLDRLLTMRCFSHLTRVGLYSFLIATGEREAKGGLHRGFLYNVVRADRNWFPGHVNLKRLYSVQTWYCGVTDEKPRRVPEFWYMFDLGNTRRFVAWRLGVCCSVCKTFLGRRLYEPACGWYGGLGLQSMLAEMPGAICAECFRLESLSVKKYRRATGDYRKPPPDEWLILDIIERKMRQQKRKRKVA